MTTSESRYVPTGIGKAMTMLRQDPQAQSKPARVLEDRPSTEPGRKTEELWGVEETLPKR